MTPNKIYLSKLVMAGEEILDKPVSDDDVEYIRKEAIVEMLKGYSHPLTRLMVQELIDRLNSL